MMRTSLVRRVAPITRAVADDDAVRWIPWERLGERRDLGGNRGRDTAARDERWRRRPIEPLAQREKQPDSAEAVQHRDLPEADVRDQERILRAAAADGATMGSG